MFLKFSLRLRLWIVRYILRIAISAIECKVCAVKHICLNEDTRTLIGEFSAQRWAEEFVKRVREDPRIATSESTMLGWFANAIMAGYDRAKNGG